MTYQPLRPRQEQAMDAIGAALVEEGSHRMVVQAPTGFGKTRLAAEIVDRTLARHNRIIFTVPAISLIDQTVEMFKRNDICDIGVIQRQHELTDISKPVQIASVQTLIKRDLFPHDVVVIDECHRWYKAYEGWMSSPDWEDVPFIGLSATPWTKGLGKWFKKLIIAGTIKDGITEGWLSKIRAFAPTIPDLRGVRTLAGDYHQKDLAKAYDIPPLTADIVDTWRQFGQGRPTFLFAIDRAHAAHLAEQFEAVGVKTAYVDAFTPLDERENIRQSFERDEIEIVCNVGVLTTGIDWDVRCIILARPTKSEMLYVQMVGRGLRRTPDGKEEKDHLLLLDHTGTSLSLGLVEDIHHDTLDDGKKKVSFAGDPPVPKPKICPKCKFLKPPRVHACPACGFAPTKQSKREPVPGELFEISAPVEHPASAWQIKERWYRMLKHRCLERGYKPGWVAVNFKERFGEWPPREWAGLMPLEPNDEVLSWLLSKIIRYSKRRKAA